MKIKRILVFFIIIIILIPLIFLFIKQRSQKAVSKPGETQAQKAIPTPHYNTSNQNIILISVDTVDPSHLGVYGYPKKTSPQIDEFAKDATVFNSLYTLIPHTFDSFYTLLTGRNDVLKDEEINQSSSTISEWGPKKQTLPKILKQNGYQTVAFVTNHVIGTLTPFFKINFEQFNFIDTSKSSAAGGLDSFIADYQNGEKITEGAMNWLSKNGDQKFFLWLHYTNPHMPYNPPLADLCQIDPANCKSETYQVYLREPLKTKAALDDCTKTKSQAVVDTMRNLYDGELVSVDREIGQFLKYLKDINLYENSTIIFYADHGEGFNHNIFEHGYDLYNNGVHIPLVIKDSTLPKGSRIDTLMDNSDILPSLLSLRNIQYDKQQFTGQDFKQSKRDAVYLLAEPYKGNKYAIFDGTFKYIYSDEPGCFYKDYREELYNLKTDPLEMTNIISSEPKKTKELKTKLMDEIKSWGKVKNIGGVDKSKEVIDKLKKLGY